MPLCVFLWGGFQTRAAVLQLPLATQLSRCRSHDMQAARGGDLARTSQPESSVIAFVRES